MPRFVFIVAVLLVLGGVAQGLRTPAHMPSQTEFRSMFKQYVREYDKEYSVDSAADAYMNFCENVEKIVQHNKANSTWFAAVNQFTDLSFEQFRDRHLSEMLSAPVFLTHQVGKPLPARLAQRGTLRSDTPETVNWVDAGAVTPVEDQGACGSCWAFSAAGALESIIALKCGQLEPLSKQQLLDCSGAYGNAGCQGGLMTYAYDYIIDNHGLCLQSAYPYRARQSFFCQAGLFCKSDQYSAQLTSYVNTPENNELALKAAVAQQPVAVAVEANEAWQHYGGGIMSKSSCGTSLNHGVLAAGYGHSTSVNEAFWLVKNSWGKGWGENGYICLAREDSTGNPGTCGIAMMATYPVLSS